jgi:hypothetical protein
LFAFSLFRILLLPTLYSRLFDLSNGILGYIGEVPHSVLCAWMADVDHRVVLFLVVSVVIVGHRNGACCPQRCIEHRPALDERSATRDVRPHHSCVCLL